MLTMRSISICMYIRRDTHTELELKLAVLPAGADLDPETVFAVARRHFVLVAPPRTLRLDNRYFRDAEGRLQASRATLRARLQGSEHRGTIKAPGALRDGVRERLEVEASLGFAPSTGDPLPPELANGLAKIGVQLDHWPQEHFRTVFERTRAVLELGGGVQVVPRRPHYEEWQPSQGAGTCPA